jgi:hypothetical protein
MLAGVAGVPFVEPTRFQEACQMIDTVIKSEGDQEWKQAKARCFVSGVKKEVIEEFEILTEDVLLMSERSQYGPIIIADRKGGVITL